MINFVLILAILSLSHIAQGNIKAPLSTDQLPKVYDDETAEKHAIQLTDYSDNKSDVEVYSRLKKFISSCNYNLPKEFSSSIYEGCFAKQAKIKSFDRQIKKPRDMGFDEYKQDLLSMRKDVDFSETFLSNEPVWAHKLKKHPNWYFIIYIVDQKTINGTYQTTKSVLVHESKGQFKIYRKKNAKSFYDLQKSKPRNFIEFVAKQEGDQTISRILSLELTPTNDGFNYLFSIYAGDGLNERRGKLDKQGRIVEREIQYWYCAHSMGSENRCYVAKLKQNFNPKTGKSIKIEGLYQEDYRETKKNITKVIIKDLKSLEKAKQPTEDRDNREIYKNFFTQPVPVEFLKKTKYCWDECG